MEDTCTRERRSAGTREALVVRAAGCGRLTAAVAAKRGLCQHKAPAPPDTCPGGKLRVIELWRQNAQSKQVIWLRSPAQTVP